MILRVPEYYEKFSCIASRCKDSCCAGWEIDIDEDSYAYYNSVEGKFGKRLKESMYEADPDDDGGNDVRTAGASVGAERNSDTAATERCSDDACHERLVAKKGNA